MNVSRIEPLWHLPGCGDKCWQRWHDPEAHEAFGRLQGRRERRNSQRTATGGLVVDAGAFRATVDGHAVHIPPVEFRLLAVLAADPGRCVPYPEIMAEVWGPGHYNPRTPRCLHLVRVSLGRLRRTLGPAGDLITTITGVGLRLAIVPPVEPTP